MEVIDVVALLILLKFVDFLLHLAQCLSLITAIALWYYFTEPKLLLQLLRHHIIVNARIMVFTIGKVYDGVAEDGVNALLNTTI